MASPKQDPYGLIVTLGVFALATLGLAFYMKKRDEPASEEPAAPPPSPPGPTAPATTPGAQGTPPALPGNDFKPAPKGASGFDMAQRPPFDHVVILYTSRWAGDHWGQWDGPTAWDGRLVTPADFFHAAVWLSPEREMLEQLEALGVTNATPGFWAAYKLPIIEDANGTHYGAPGPWVSGHFGTGTSYGDGSHVSVILSADASGHQVEFNANQWA